MVDDVAGVAELGVLTAPAEEWSLAVRRAEVIGQLARGQRVGIAAVDEAAAELGVSRRQVYELLRRWRTGSGVVSDLLPRRSSGGRGRARVSEEVEALLLEVIRGRYLSSQRRSVSAIYKEVVRQCRIRGLVVPSRGTLERRIGRLDPVASVMARQGADAARALRSAGGEPPLIEGLLEQVQIDHTIVDLEIISNDRRGEFTDTRLRCWMAGLRRSPPPLLCRAGGSSYCSPHTEGGRAWAVPAVAGDAACGTRRVCRPTEMIRQRHRR